MLASAARDVQVCVPSIVWRSTNTPKPLARTKMKAAWHAAARCSCHMRPTVAAVLDPREVNVVFLSSSARCSFDPAHLVARLQFVSPRRGGTSVVVQRVRPVGGASCQGGGGTRERGK